MFRHELITWQTDTVPQVLASTGGLALLIPDIVVPGMLSGDKYRATLDDGNVTGDKGQLGVIVTQAAGTSGPIAAFCEPELVDIRTVLGRLFPCVSTNGGQRRRLGVVSSASARFAPSGSVSGLLSSPRSDI